MPADASFSDAMSKANPMPEWYQRADAAVNQPFSRGVTGGPVGSLADVAPVIPQSKTEAMLLAAGLIPGGKLLKGAKGALKIGTAALEGAAPEVGALSRGMALAGEDVLPGRALSDKLSAPMKVDVVRHQSSPGVSETGSAGGTFYLADTPENAESLYKRPADQPNYIGSGGNVEIKRSLDLKNPLLLPHGEHQLGQQVLESLTSLSRNDFESLYQGAKKVTASDPNIQAIAEEVGLPVDELVEAIKRGQKAGYVETGPMDAIAVELLKKHGHDAAVQVSGGAPSGEVLHVPTSR
jgi:hypothetical protein